MYRFPWAAAGFQNLHTNTLEGTSNGYQVQEWSCFSTRSSVGSTKEATMTVKVSILKHAFPPIVLCQCLVKTVPGKMASKLTRELQSKSCVGNWSWCDTKHHLKEQTGPSGEESYELSIHQTVESHLSSIAWQDAAHHFCFEVCLFFLSLETVTTGDTSEATCKTLWFSSEITAAHLACFPVWCFIFSITFNSAWLVTDVQSWPSR